MLLPIIASSEQLINLTKDLLVNYNQFKISRYDFIRKEYISEQDELPTITSGTVVRYDTKIHIKSEQSSAHRKRGKIESIILDFERISNNDYILNTGKMSSKKVESISAQDIRTEEARNKKLPLVLNDSFLTTGKLCSMCQNLCLGELIQFSTLISTENDIFNGVSCTKIIFENIYGIYTLWLDPSRNNIILKLTQNKDKNHLYSKTPKMRLGEVLLFDEDSVKEYYGGFTSEYIATKIQRIDNRYYVTSYRAKFVSVSASSNNKSEKIIEETLSNVKFDETIKNYNFKPKNYIPNGTPVTVSQDRLFRYEWRNGEIVKIESNPELEAVVPVLAPPRRRWELLIGGGVAFVLLFSLFWWRYRRGPA